MDPFQGDKIGGREMDHGIPRDDIIADRGMQGVPIRKAISVHVDEIVLRRRAANDEITLIEVFDDVVAGADAENELVVVGSTRDLIITGPAI